MLLRMLRSKIHNAIVTDTDLEYEGSITIPSELMKKAGMLPYEQVQVYNITNGNRLETYTIEGEPCSDRICMNGAAAHLASPGDRIIIASFCFLEPGEVKDHKPIVIAL
ncbi:aspartate 1-decarboxylase [bacterium]|nr:aspartate 1-decarboxylase [bacterium]